MVVCSQDEGAPGEENGFCSLDDEQALYPEFPGSSPYVMAVGSTAIKGSGSEFGKSGIPRSALSQTLQPICTEFNCTRDEYAEVVADMPSSGFTSGGGFSRYASQPAYQQAAVEAYMKSVALPPASKFNGSNRGYPDVSSIGQNIPIVYSGAYLPTGGTSASTPIWAGVLTLINDFLISNNEAPLGFPNPLLYQMAAKQPNTFNKVLSGNNSCTEENCCKYGFVVNPAGGWNPATGLGTPNYLNIISYLQNEILRK
jgi:tripeptidyl-peptidase-1